MFGLHLFILLSLTVTSLAADFEIAVRSTVGDIQKWGTLRTESGAPSSVEYTPAPGHADQIMEGCLGVLKPAGFDCQTIFVRDDSRQALLVTLQNDGSLIQAAFNPGPRSEVQIQFPGEVPRPVLKPPTRATGPHSPKQGSPSGATHADDDATEPEKSFVEKYWIYIIPIGLIVISNMVNNGGGAAQ